MNNLVITNKGLELITRLIAKETTVQFTKIKTSDKNYIGVDIKNLNDISPVQEVLISSIEKYDTNNVVIEAVVNNADLLTGYYIKALGLYAKDDIDNEILYAVYIESENPDFIPAQSNISTGITYKLIVNVSDTDQVDFRIDPSGVVTEREFNELKDEIDAYTKITVPIDEWETQTDSESKTYYTREIEVKGMTEKKSPLADFDRPDPYVVTEYEAILEAYNVLTDVKSGDNKIILTASEIPKTSFNILLKGFKEVQDE